MASEKENNLKRFRHAQRVLGISMLIMGGCGIVYEYTLGALGNNLLGSSHEQIFVIIGLMMFAMGIGSAIQKRIVGDLVDKFLLIEILLGLVGGVSVLVISVAFGYTASFKLVLYIFALVIGLFIGLEIPLLIRINKEYSESLRSNIGEILCMDYVGALIGALIFTYVLISRVTIDKIALILGMVNLAIGLIGLLYFWPLVKRRVGILALALSSFGLLTVGMFKTGDWMATIEQRTYRDPIIFTKTSPYQHVVLTKRNDRVSMFINSHLQFSSEDEFIYHEFLVHIPMHVAEDRSRVLILGGGDGLALREVLKYPEVREVHLVDLDPMITDLATNHEAFIRLNGNAFSDARVEAIPTRGIEPGEKKIVERPSILAHEMHEKTIYRQADVQVFNVDADLFIRQFEQRYDVIIIDFPDPRQLELSKLYSVNFYKALKSVMRPNTIVSIQSTNPVAYRNVFLCIGKTLNEAGYTRMPYHQHVPSFGEWAWHLCWPGGPTSRTKDSVEEKLFNLKSLRVNTKYLTPELIPGAFAFGKGWLDDEGIEPNTKFHPVLIEFHRRARNKP